MPDKTLTGREIFLRILESINSGRRNTNPEESVDDAILQYNKLLTTNMFYRFGQIDFKINSNVGSRHGEYN